MGDFKTLQVLNTILVAATNNMDAALARHIVRPDSLTLATYEHIKGQRDELLTDIRRIEARV